MSEERSNTSAGVNTTSARPWRVLLRSPSAWFLVLANLLPLYAVLVHNWPVLPVMVLFWLENIIIGMLNVQRILLAGAEDGLAARVFVAVFFCVHYGFFAAGHGLFVFNLFGGEEYAALLDGLWSYDAARQTIHEYDLWLPLAALSASHLFSFAWNYLYKGEYHSAQTRALMHAPYGRVVVLHVALIGGGFLVQALHSPVAGLVLLIVLKIGLDLRAHLREHAGKTAAMSQPV